MQEKRGQINVNQSIEQSNKKSDKSNRNYLIQIS